MPLIRTMHSLWTMVLKTTRGMQDRQRDGVHFQLMDYGAQNKSSEEITKSLC